MNIQIRFAGVDGQPPQPTVEPSAPCDCQTDCWSLCEKSLGC